MIAPKLHERENERLEELESFSILRTLPESDYDDLTSIAAQICNTKISLVSLVAEDCQWFKSSHGLDEDETSREISFCGHVINDPAKVFIVEDTKDDERFHDNPLVTGPPFFRFYAGVALVSEKGLPLGTLCVGDSKPKNLSEDQINALKGLSNQVMNILNLRKNKLKLEETMLKLKDKNQELDKFASIAAHDIKSPLLGIQGMSQLLLEEYGPSIDAKGNEMLQLVKNSTTQLSNLVDGLLEYSKGERVISEKKSVINLEKLKNNLLELFNYEAGLNLWFESNLSEITTNRAALSQVLINLIANAIKYNDKEVVEIELGIASNSRHYTFYVKDNGPGIPKENQEKIFKIFEVTTSKDRYGKTGNGIGLATVKKIVEKSGGVIKLESELGEGSKFIFSMER